MTKAMLLSHFLNMLFIVVLLRIFSGEIDTLLADLHKIHKDGGVQGRVYVFIVLMGIVPVV